METVESNKEKEDGNKFSQILHHLEQIPPLLDTANLTMDELTGLQNYITKHIRPKLQNMKRIKTKEMEERIVEELKEKEEKFVSGLQLTYTPTCQIKKRYCHITKLDRIDRSTTNQSQVDLPSFLTSNGYYLKLEQQKFSLSEAIKKIGIKIVSGVSYDEILNLWLVIDFATGKIFRFSHKGSQNDFTSHRALAKPKAIMVFEEGKNAAILCQLNERETAIVIYDHNSKNPNLQVFASSPDALNDLGKTVAGNILTLKSADLTDSEDLNGKICIYRGKNDKRMFEVKDCKTPTKIATNKETVAISIGKAVLIYHIDDSDWNNIDFRFLKIVHSGPDLPLDQLADSAGFNGVSALQFDCGGNLLIADGIGYSIKLYDKEFNFLHRVSSDSALPTISAFHVNKSGDCLILDALAEEQLNLFHFGSSPQPLEWKLGEISIASNWMF